MSDLNTIQEQRDRASLCALSITTRARAPVHTDCLEFNGFQNLSGRGSPRDGVPAHVFDVVVRDLTASSSEGKQRELSMRV